MTGKIAGERPSRCAELRVALRPSMLAAPAFGVPSEAMLYFAYGSNMDPEQMQVRCPAAAVVGVGLLADHVLCFPRHSAVRGCGVASIKPLAGHAIWGVLYRLTADDLAALDVKEGFSPGRPEELNSYNRTEVVVSLDGAPVRALTYVAVEQKAPPLPNASYLQHMREGARRHGLPPEYVAFLDGLACA